SINGFSRKISIKYSMNTPSENFKGLCIISKFLRQTFVEWAGLSVRYSFWEKLIIGSKKPTENPIVPSSDH
ncbi:hypothetical protein ACTXIM_17755, partial [Pseudoalteromonas nigrifaciens]|uniref:hypothetical protein n=1 Tax=Pseudoalteromonas nigrifaciens TaxID=28109 RepID=UPI003FD4D518